MDIGKHYIHAYVYTQTQTQQHTLDKCISLCKEGVYIQSLPIGKSNIVELICLLMYFPYPHSFNPDTALQMQ